MNRYTMFYKYGKRTLDFSGRFYLSLVFYISLVENLLMIFLFAWLASGARDVDEEIISFAQTSWKLHQ